MMEAPSQGKSVPLADNLKCPLTLHLQMKLINIAQASLMCTHTQKSFMSVLERRPQLKPSPGNQLSGLVRAHGNTASRESQAQSFL